jgi:hypothetical protein
MGLIFLRHTYSRFLRVKGESEESLPDSEIDFSTSTTASGSPLFQTQALARFARQKITRLDASCPGAKNPFCDCATGRTAGPSMPRRVTTHRNVTFCGRPRWPALTLGSALVSTPPRQWSGARRPQSGGEPPFHHWYTQLVTRQEAANHIMKLRRGPDRADSVGSGAAVQVGRWRDFPPGGQNAPRNQG